MTPQQLEQRKLKSRERSRLRRLHNPEAVRAASRKHYWSHREQEIERNRKYKEERPEVREQYLERTREDRLQKSKEWYAANKDRHREMQYAWNRANPDKTYAISAKRRATKLNATPKWANQEAMNAIYARAKQLRKEGQDVHVDHIVPLQSSRVCGLHCEANLAIVPRVYNQSKSNRWWPDCHID